MSSTTTMTTSAMLMDTGEQHHGTGDTAPSRTLLEYRCERPCLIKSTLLLGEGLRLVLGFSDIKPCDSGS
jgi:hypothetical protein